MCVCTGRMEARGAEAYKGLLKVRRRVQNKRFVRTEGQGSFTVRLFEICVWDASQREKESVYVHIECIECIMMCTYNACDFWMHLSMHSCERIAQSQQFEARGLLFWCINQLAIDASRCIHTLHALAVFVRCIHCLYVFAYIHGRSCVTMSHSMSRAYECCQAYQSCGTHVTHM